LQPDIPTITTIDKKIGQVGPALPVLLFAGDYPTELVVGQNVNTFRKGLKWSKKLSAGDKVVLAATEGAKPFGEANVTNVITGSWDELKKLASDNHTARRFSPMEAPGILYDLLVSIYDVFSDADETFTVIYFTRTK
jgi:hypothetical protein